MYMACSIKMFMKLQNLFEAIIIYVLHRTNFQGTCISWMPQIQPFCNFIFEDHWPDCKQKLFSRTKFVACTIFVKAEKFMYIAQKFV